MASFLRAGWSRFSSSLEARRAGTTRQRAALLVAVLVGLSCTGCNSSTDMVTQPNPAPSDAPRLPVEGTLSRNGEFPLERWQIEQMVKNPLVVSEAASRRGQALFAAFCTPCHGTQGHGDGPVAKVFVQPRNLAAPEIQQHGDAWFYGAIRNGANIMPRHGPDLSQQQRWEIVQYLRTLTEPRQ